MNTNDLLNAAYRAVDACGGTYSAEQKASGYAKGHSEALDAALEAIDELLTRFNAAYQAVETVLQDYTR